MAILIEDNNPTYVNVPFVFERPILRKNNRITSEFAEDIFNIPKRKKGANIELDIYGISGISIYGTKRISCSLFGLGYNGEEEE